jgi:hypothetical protein
MRSPLATIIATISYADIFKYPLTNREILKWGVGYKLTLSDIEQNLNSVKLLNHDYSKLTYFHLPGRGVNVKIRETRQQFSQKKWRLAKKSADFIGILPTVEFIGVTGGLAMNNADYNDDIDFLIITTPNALWITRMLTVVVTELFSVRRRPGEKEKPDSICLNMFLTDDSLTIPKNEQDLYGAHELLQMKPLLNKHNTYKHLLEANYWTSELLPSAWQEAQTTQFKSGSVQKFNLFWLFEYLMINFLSLFEYPLKIIQLKYMERHRTREVITSKLLRFHPHDARPKVMEEYRKRLLYYGLPLDKFFYSRIK